jgi:hypothetical protein
MTFNKTALALALGTLSLAANASSHREAPFIAQNPSVDGTDFYMFRSYEAGRAGFVTILANYNPLQDTYGGPNYFAMNPNALYEIHIDNNGDSVEDLTFQFKFTNTFAGVTVNGATSGTAVPVAIPLVNAGATNTGGSTAALNRTESYTVGLVRGPRRGSAATLLTNASGGGTTFVKPVDNIGNKSFPDYKDYANQYIYNVNIPGCSATGARLFVGQRQEGFVVNLGEVFDLINLNPLGPRTGSPNTIGDKNITTLALEVPVACLTNGTEPVIGGWTTSSLRQGRVLNPTPQGPITAPGQTQKGTEVVGGAWTQVSRLGSPLVNEVVIGITDKDKFNGSEPKNDVANFGAYVLYPALPVLVNSLFSVPTPATPRTDLLAAFVTGIATPVNGVLTNFTKPAAIAADGSKGAGEMLRLNTAFPTAVTAVAPAPGTSGTSDLGFLACDLNGFPNGRRVTDDVTDIELTVAEGALTGTNSLQTCNVAGPTPTVMNAGAVVTDGAEPVVANYLTTFPYLNVPIPGSPNGANGFPADGAATN